MSLDVYLTGEEIERKCECSMCGNLHTRKAREEYFSQNITHNLANMAEEAGIYKHCWRPEEIGITKARQLIEPLENAIFAMRANPERFKKHNASNGWGLYEHFLPWLENYLAACKATPEANVSVWR